MLVEIVDDDGIVLRGEDEAGMLCLPLWRGERDRAESLDEGRFDIGRDGTGIVHKEDERIAFFRVIVLWNVKVVGECRAALRGILEYCLLEILDDEFAHARRFCDAEGAQSSPAVVLTKPTCTTCASMTGSGCGFP